MGECQFHPEESERKVKVTEHEVALVAAPGIIIRSDQSPLTFPIRRSIPLPRNLSVTRYFFAFTGSRYSKGVWGYFTKSID